MGEGANKLAAFTQLCQLDLDTDLIRLISALFACLLQEWQWSFKPCSARLACLNLCDWRANGKAEVGIDRGLGHAHSRLLLDQVRTLAYFAKTHISPLSDLRCFLVTGAVEADRGAEQEQQHFFCVCAHVAGCRGVYACVCVCVWRVPDSPGSNL